nr:MAG TPA: hypothetical protein [Caudoviricetes sp.]
MGQSQSWEPVPAIIQNRNMRKRVLCCNRKRRGDNGRSRLYSEVMG